MSPFQNDPYCYSGADVLINKGDYRTHVELDRFEADAVFLASAAFKSRPIQGAFDTRRLQETHRRLFGNVYPWAGELRKDIGMMAKTRASGFVVAYGPSENVPGALASTFAALKAENSLRGLGVEAIALRTRLLLQRTRCHSRFPGRKLAHSPRAYIRPLPSGGLSARLGPGCKSAEQRQRLYHARDLAVMRGDTSGLAQILSANLRAV